MFFVFLTTFTWSLQVEGNNDGTKAGEHYFDCKGDKYGCFVSPDNASWRHVRTGMRLEALFYWKDDLIQMGRCFCCASYGRYSAVFKSFCHICVAFTLDT